MTVGATPGSTATLYINTSNGGTITLDVQRIVSTAAVTLGTTYTIISGAQLISVTNSDNTSFTTPTLNNPTNISQDFTVSDNSSAESWNVEIAETAGGTYYLEVVATAPTPEPGSLGLLGVASLGLLRRRRRGARDAGTP
jgi:hypothetical protein